MCGILDNSKARTLFKKINETPECEKCRKDRKEFIEKDKKYKIKENIDHYSNLSPGFSSVKIRIPIDILIIGEAHSGKGKKYFREQEKLVDDEVSEMMGDYLGEKLKTFHQKQIRALIRTLDRDERTWVFTDLVKCFVWHNKGKKLDGKGDILDSKEQKKKALEVKDNFGIAVTHCKEYLEDQIKILNPKLILCLGGKVRGEVLGLLYPEILPDYKNKSIELYPWHN